MGNRILPDEECFEAMKAAIDAGATFWNAGVFYGRGPQCEPFNLHLIARFFTCYPELADKVFLSVKGGVNMKFQPQADPEFLRKDVEGVLQALDGKKKLDMFECARVDPNVSIHSPVFSSDYFSPIEISINALSQMVKEGKFDHIGLSEVSAESIRRAHKIHPIATVEIEYSLWATEAKANGILDTTKDLGIAIIAYSPLGRGMLTGKWRTFEDVPQHLREYFPRFSRENFQHNLQFLHIIDEIARKKSATPAQIAIKWVLTVDDHIIPIPGAVTVGRVKENMRAADVELTEDELAELNRFVEQTEPRGGRYRKEQEKYLFG